MAKIYYYSGTGNSYQVARKLSEKIHQCDLIKITENTQKPGSDHETIGVVFPVYYFGLPRVVEDFLKDLEPARNAYVFLIATRGIPFAGGVRKQLLNILGESISYFQYITMGDNFNIDFWDSSTNKTKERRNRECDATISDIALSVIRRRRRRRFAFVDFLWFITSRLPRYGYQEYINNIYNSDHCFSVNAAICTQCKKCVQSCPVENVGFDQTVQWLHKNCQLCLACYHCCPVNAVHYHNGRLTTTGKSQYWNY